MVGSSRSPDRKAAVRGNRKTKGNRYVVSARFTGQIREDNGPAESVDEIWHLIKPRNGNGGWLLAGIQQVQ